MQTTEQTHALARAIAERLPGFEYVEDARQRNADGELHWCARLTSVKATYVESPVATVGDSVPWHNRHLQLYIAPSSAKRGKMVVSLDAPHVQVGKSRVWTGDAVRSGGLVSVYVSPDRDPSTIARDLLRRIVPDAREQWSVMLSWLADREAYATCELDVSEQMRAMGATVVDNGAGWLKSGDLHIAFSVEGSSVRFHVMTLDATKACAVLAALKGP